MTTNHSANHEKSAALSVDRRQFLQTAGAGVVAAAAIGSGAARLEAADAKSSPETTVKELYKTLTPRQQKQVCFDWDHVDSKRGLLRTRLSNNWHITKPTIKGDFYSVEQQGLIRQIFEGIIQPEWHAKIDKQLQDDAGGFGNDQNIAIFGNPGDGKFELVMTGRHMTLRCDGNSADHVAFGGPIFYGHAAQGFYEKSNHPGNVFWEQALEANKVYEMLDGAQRKKAEVAKLPAEQRSGFRKNADKIQGIAVSELSSDQVEGVESVLKKLIEPYRQSDKDEALACLKSQGGLKACRLAFYTEEDLGKDRVWDNWRLEGPAFVWHFRGAPHVHVWVNVSDDPSVKLNA